MVADLQARAKGLGLPFGPRTMTYNSRLAQELGLWADSKGRGHAFHMAAFRAYFAHGHNLAREDVLLTLVHDAGLCRSEAQTILADRSWAARVDSDWQYARDMGITAVPTFVCGSGRLIGAQSYDSLAALVTGHSQG